MQKSLLTNIKSLLLTALIAGTVWSCRDEKPEIHIPDPVTPQKEFKHVETITPDTLTFNEGDSAVFSLRTIPYNLLSRKNITVQIADTAGAKYEFAEIKSYKLVASTEMTDSIWNIVMNMKYGMQSGDIISIMIADEDTVIYSDETVLNMIPADHSDDISIRVLNRESIAAFIEGSSTATVRIRTNPYDLLFNDTLNYLFLTDSLEHSLRKTFTIDSISFVPSDSTWAVRINILDSSIDSTYILLKLIASDSAYYSTPVYIKKVNISMTSVKTGNDAVMKFDSKTNTYSYCLPTRTDFSDQKFLFIHNGERVTVGDIEMTENEYNTLDANKPITVSVWKYEAHKDYIIKVTNTGLPIVRINTNGQSVTRRDVWVEGNTMRIELPDGTTDYEGTLSLKGRGNGTWTETNKKPYAIRLDEKAKILGMHKQKRWILLANYKDRTLLRNDAAFWLSRHSGMPYTVSGQFVELVWNGKHMGNYYLCEQARIDNHRIDIVSPNLTDPDKGGIFMEIDAFLDYNNSGQNGSDKVGDVGFWSTGVLNQNTNKGRYNLPYIFKDPDEDENGIKLTKSSATYTYMVNYVKAMEEAIYKSDQSDDWMNYLDIDRAVDFALINEITMNHDSYNTWPVAGPHSAFLYKDSCGPICFGPIWDFDYHTFTLYNDGSNGNQASGENSRIKQWEILKMDSKGSSGGWGGWGGGGSSSGNKYYFADLAKRSPKFRERLLERWNEYKYVWRDSLPIYIDQMANYIRLSESYNIQVWAENTTKSNYKQNGDYNLSFQNAVAAMKSAFLKRWAWMDENLPKLGQ